MGEFSVTYDLSVAYMKYNVSMEIVQVSMEIIKVSMEIIQVSMETILQVSMFYRGPQERSSGFLYF